MAYANTKVYPTFEDYVAKVGHSERPHVIFVGCPAAFHGADVPGADLELRILKAFPNAGIFVEKPISASPVPNCLNVAQAIEDRRTICSVGYMLRYLKVVQRMKQIIEENNLTVMATVAR